MTRIYNGDGFDWTPERVELLRKLWAGGMSSSEIGSRFGITKNAVIGKVQRLGISERDKSPKHAKVQAGKRQGKANAARKTIARFAAKPKLATVIAWQENFPAYAENPPLPRAQTDRVRVPRDIPPAPVCTPITMEALFAGVCHWPIDPDAEHGWRYCGAPRNPHSSGYCTHHHARLIDDAGRQRFLARGR